MITHVSFDTELTKDVSLDQIMFLNYIIDGCERSKLADYFKHNGEYWFPRTAKQWKEDFPYFSAYWIRTRLQILEDKGYIEVGEYDPSKWNHTRWYKPTKKTLKVIFKEKMTASKQKSLRKSKIKTVDVAVSPLQVAKADDAKRPKGITKVEELKAKSDAHAFQSEKEKCQDIANALGEIFSMHGLGYIEDQKHIILPGIDDMLQKMLETTPNPEEAFSHIKSAAVRTAGDLGKGSLRVQKNKKLLSIWFDRFSDSILELARLDFQCEGAFNRRR